VAKGGRSEKVNKINILQKNIERKSTNVFIIVDSKRAYLLKKMAI